MRAVSLSTFSTKISKSAYARLASGAGSFSADFTTSRAVEFFSDTVLLIGRDLPARQLERAPIGRDIVGPGPRPNRAQLAKSVFSGQRVRSLDGRFLPRGRCRRGGGGTVEAGGPRFQRGDPPPEELMRV